jgi:uncharacterized lipoprotein YddW (UPF0748 family)
MNGGGSKWKWKVCRLLTCFVVVGANASAGEFRGLWVDGFGPGFFNEQQVTKLASDCRKYNFNAVLVEMRRRGDAFYDSKYDPRTTIIPTNFDALAAIIKECHTGTPRIEVHCWMVSHFIWAWEKPPTQRDHVFNRHPEYLTRDFIGQKLIDKGYFLDPGNPDANLTIYAAARDVVSRYDIDGLHWDYCRYSAQDSGYNQAAINRYNDEFGLTGQPPPNDPKFSEWRRRQVTDFLRWVDADLWAIKPGLVITASVFANLRDSYAYRFADWPTWIRDGLVDACLPMDFSPDNKNVFFPRADAAIKYLGNRNIYLGQAAYMNTREKTAEQLDYARQKGFPGTALYSYRSPNEGPPNPEEVFAFLKEKLQPAWTNTPSLPWKQSRGIIKGTVTNKDTGLAVYNALVTLNADPARAQKTEPHGKYAFFDLNPGRYTIHLQAGASDAAMRTVELKAAQVLDVDLVLRR